MMTIQSNTVAKLLKRGFTRSRKHDSKTVYLWKRVRPWEQLIAAVEPDGSVNGGTAEAFLEMP
jgi:hypothetical protein